MILHVAIGFKEKTVPHAVIQNRAFSGMGWARYSPNCWVVQLTKSPKEISDEIRKLVSTADSIFVCEVNLKNNGGYLSPEVWKWINLRIAESKA